MLHANEVISLFSLLSLQVWHKIRRQEFPEGFSHIFCQEVHHFVHFVIVLAVWMRLYD